MDEVAWLEQHMYMPVLGQIAARDTNVERFDLKPWVPFLQQVIANDPVEREKAFKMDLYHPGIEQLGVWAVAVKKLKDQADLEENRSSDKAGRRPSIDADREGLQMAQQALASAWKSEYKKEKTAQFFLAGIKERVKDDLRYSNTIPIVQSSGMGKSRLVDQVACQILTFPVCLRDEEKRGLLSHPPADDHVRNFLKRPPLLEHPPGPASLEIAIRCFFIALFHEAASRLAFLAPQDADALKLAEWWRMWLATDANRTTLYDKVTLVACNYVKAAASQFFQEATEAGTADRPTIAARQAQLHEKKRVKRDEVVQIITGVQLMAMNRTDTAMDVDDVSFNHELTGGSGEAIKCLTADQLWDVNIDLQYRLSAILVYKLETLLGVMKKLAERDGLAGKFLEQRLIHQSTATLLIPEFEDGPPVHHVEILVAFDEAHTLKDLQPVTSLFHTLRKIPIYMVYLSTTSAVSILAPRAGSIDSQRYREKNLRLQPPFTELPMKLFARELWDKALSRPLVYLRTFCEVALVASLGRPLWSAIIKGGIPASLHALVTEKLWRSDIKENTVDVILACRFLLQMQNSMAGVKLATQLVSGHLATAFHVTSDREEMFIGYPAEPLVAAAATEYMVRGPVASSTVAIMVDGKQEHRNKHVNRLIQMMNFDIIDKGHLGELVGRVCYLLARDDAFAQDNADYKALLNCVEYLEPVSLITFLDCLIGKHKESGENACARRLCKGKSESMACDGGCKMGEVRALQYRRMDGSAATFEDLFKQAVVHFVSWGHADDKADVMSVPNAIRMLAQGCAIQCHSQQRTFDLVIPIVMDPRKALTAGNLGMIAVQIKNRKHHEAPVIHMVDFPKNLPVIFIFHELDGLGKTWGVNCSVLRCALSGRTSRSSSCDPCEAPLFQLCMRGVNPALLSEKQCAQLLQPHTILQRYEKTWASCASLAQEGVSAMHEQGMYTVGMNKQGNGWADIEGRGDFLHTAGGPRSMD